MTQRLSSPNNKISDCVGPIPFDPGNYDGANPSAPVEDSMIASTAFKVPGLSNVVDIFSGNGVRCIVRRGGEVSCAGKNNLGQLGTGDLADQYSFEQKVNLRGPIIKLAIAEHHSCALFADGGIQCWGSNYKKLLNSGSDATILTSPTDILLPEKAISISVGSDFIYGGENPVQNFGHTCFISETKKLYCWGLNQYGQVFPEGEESINQPILIELPDRVKTVSAGIHATCASLVNDKQMCWGGYDQWLGVPGQLGHLGGGIDYVGSTYIPPVLPRVPQAELSVLSNTGLLTSASKLFDGNRETEALLENLPAEIVIDLGGSYSISGLLHYEAWTRIRDYEIYISTDGVNWGSAVSVGQLGLRNNAQVKFSPKTGSYLKLVYLKSSSGSNYAYTSELDILVDL